MSFARATPTTPSTEGKRRSRFSYTWGKRRPSSALADWLAASPPHDNAEVSLLGKSRDGKGRLSTPSSSSRGLHGGGGEMDLIWPQDGPHDRISRLHVVMRLEPPEIGDVLLPYVSYMREDGTEVAQRSQDILFQSRESPRYIWLRMRSNDHRGELLDKLDAWYTKMMGDDFDELAMDQVTEQQALNIISRHGLRNAIEHAMEADAGDGQLSS
eukprot:TRINITY_DN9366_c0_g1_i1.p1 TRINITY_DN9366_c0_g1~~TRINITY_DN9366_c0_g1_i1.p1  ORF type:complete len:213 (+),score=50.94 TRINITY_DN9366_c0_g1_i1:130-768(+)